MAKLEDLIPNFKEMTDEQKRAKILEVREDRKISKHAETVRKSRAVKKEDKIRTAIGKLSEEEKAKLRDMLKDEE